MRVVVTGASGNLGTALLRRLRAVSQHQMVGLSRRRPPQTPPYAGLEWHTADLADEVGAAPALADAVRGADAVIHLVWQLQPSRDRAQMKRTNVGGTRLVADAAREAGAAHLIHVSSIGAYSPGPGKRVDESWPALGVPTSSYSRDKAACEELLDQYDDNLLISRIRPTLVLQPDAASEIARYFLGPLVPVSALHPVVLRRLPWPAQLALQFVHADDVAAAITAVLDARAGGAFNVAAEPAVDRGVVRQLFDGVGPALPPRLLRTLAGVTWRLRLQPTEPGWLDLALAVPLLDCSRLHQLGWHPRHAGTDVLREFVAALRHRRGRAGPLLYPRTFFKHDSTARTTEETSR